MSRFHVWLKRFFFFFTNTLIDQEKEKEKKQVLIDKIKVFTCYVATFALYASVTHRNASENAASTWKSVLGK